jgi:hypothetical protein
MTDIEKLKESMHALVTPPFSGTHEEMIAAVGYWVTMISHLRSMFNIVTGHDNRAAIIDQLEKEVGIIKSELENLTAKVVTDPATGQTSMVQPVAEPINQPGPPPVPAMVEPTPITLSATQTNESLLDRIRANAGVPQNSIKVHPLSKLSK